jgi:quercetin dioxygenase-like cupin family protein
MRPGNRFARTFLVALGFVLVLAARPLEAAETSVAFAHADAGLTWGPCPAFMPEGCGIAVLHGDPSKDNADVFFKVPAGAVIPLHWHTSAERMVLVSGELEVTYEGEKAVVLRTGTYAYGPPKKPHSATCAKGAPCVLFIAFESPVDAVAGKPPAP